MYENAIDRWPKNVPTGHVRSEETLCRRVAVKQKWLKLSRAPCPQLAHCDVGFFLVSLLSRADILGAKYGPPML